MNSKSGANAGHHQAIVAAPGPPWAETLAHWLDNAVAIPGTRIRVGLDALLGLILPGAGDAATAIATAAFIWAGIQRGVPKVILLRMLLNVLFDQIIGTIPVVGDVFDVFNRAASKNLALLRTYGSDGYQPTLGDYAVVTLVFVGLGALLITPLLLLFGLLYAVLS